MKGAVLCDNINENIYTVIHKYYSMHVPMFLCCMMYAYLQSQIKEPGTCFMSFRLSRFGFVIKNEGPGDRSPTVPTRTSPPYPLYFILKQVSYLFPPYLLVWKDESSVAVHGRLAYAPQEPWIQSGTVQENILFGKRMDRKRYIPNTLLCLSSTPPEDLP